MVILPNWFSMRWMIQSFKENTFTNRNHVKWARTVQSKSKNLRFILSTIHRFENSQQVASYVKSSWLYCQTKKTTVVTRHKILSIRLENPYTFFPNMSIPWQWVMTSTMVTTLHQNLWKSKHVNLRGIYKIGSTGRLLYYYE